MPKAVWNGEVLAESDRCEVVEDTCYFPPEALNRQFFQRSHTKSHCPWKGDAYYYDITVRGETNRDAAWYYPDPKEEASRIRGYVAFWHGVEIEY